MSRLVCVHDCVHDRVHSRRRGPRRVWICGANSDPPFDRLRSFVPPQSRGP